MSANPSGHRTKLGLTEMTRITTVFADQITEEEGDTAKIVRDFRLSKRADNGTFVEQSRPFRITPRKYARKYRKYRDLDPDSTKTKRNRSKCLAIKEDNHLALQCLAEQAETKYASVLRQVNKSQSKLDKAFHKSDVYHRLASALQVPKSRRPQLDDETKRLIKQRYYTYDAGEIKDLMREYEARLLVGHDMDVNCSNQVLSPSYVRNKLKFRKERLRRSTYSDDRDMSRKIKKARYRLKAVYDRDAEAAQKVAEMYNEDNLEHRQVVECLTPQIPHRQAVARAWRRLANKSAERNPMATYNPHESIISQSIYDFGGDASSDSSEEDPLEEYYEPF